MPEDDEGGRVIRFRLRRPEMVERAEGLSAIPNSFDALFPKPYYAYQLRLAGHDWPHIAAKLNYRSGPNAEDAVRKWLYRTNEARQKEWAVTKDQMHTDAINSECDRLDALQAAYWQDAIEGDIPSANFVLKVIAQRAKLLGLETQAAQVTHQLNTLVVGGTESEYVAALLKARDSLGPAASPKVIDGSNDDRGVVD